MIDQSRGAARRRGLLSRLQAVLHAYQSDPVFRRRLVQSPFEAMGLEETGTGDGDAPGTRRAHPQGFGAAVTGLMVFGEPGARGSATPPLDARLVASGLRPAALLHMPEGAAVSVLHWAEAHGLYGLLSYHQWQNRIDAGKGCYSNSTGATIPALPGSGAMRSVILSPDPARAVTGWIAVALGWDDTVGAVLGYPDCCRRFFDGAWTAALEDHQGDVAPLTLAASGEGPFDWRLNVFMRYFGAELASHFPCRFDCPSSLAEARRLEAGLGRLGLSSAAGTRETMAGVVLYTETDGVAFAPGARIAEDAACHAARWEMSDPQGRLARALAGGTAPRREGGAVRIGETVLPGAMVAFEETARAEGGAPSPPPPARAEPAIPEAT